MRTVSDQAQVAKLCKAFCKELKIKCTVKSASFSMGTSVDITVYDQPIFIMKKLREEFSKYERGHFDGTTDTYEYSNVKEDIPQTKFLTVHCG